MKKVVVALVIGVTLFSIMLCSVFAESNELSVYLDAVKIEFDVKPQIINGRTMVPIRAIFEKMGAVVEWDGSTNTAICTKDDVVVKMTVNSMDMHINNQVIKMDTAPVVVDGRTLAPARYVAEAFGADVQWSQKNNAVVICSEDVYAYADYPHIPDLGRCYNTSLISTAEDDGFVTYSYIYNDFENEEYYSYIYDNSAKILGDYIEETLDVEDDIVYIQYTKPNQVEPSYYIAVTYVDDGSLIFVVLIPSETVTENTVTLYAADGRTIEVLENEVPAYKNVGWYETEEEANAANKALINNNSSDLNNPTADGYYYRTPTGKRYHLDPNCGGKNSYRTTNISGLTPCAKCAQ